MWFKSLVPPDYHCLTKPSGHGRGWVVMSPLQLHWLLSSEDPECASTHVVNKRANIFQFHSPMCLTSQLQIG